MKGPHTIVPTNAVLAHGLAPVVGTPAPLLENHGGLVLGAVDVAIIYWGAAWSIAENLTLSAQLDEFFDFILTSSYMDLFSEYGTTTTPIGHGRRVASVHVSTTEPGKATPLGRQVSDVEIQRALQGWIAAGITQATTPNTLYFVYLPPNVVSSMKSGEKSCNDYCGYHNAINNVYYAVIPYATCPTCAFPGNFLDSLTEVSSHELGEAITDPALDTWWDGNSGSEIGDICNRKTFRLGGYLVQSQWSNVQHACVITPLSLP